MLRNLKRRLDQTGFRDYASVIKKIEQYEYVSFDVFDTLIKRDVYKPTDVFELMERSTNIEGFAQARMRAEQKARVVLGKVDITLTDIYDYLEYDINVSDIMEMERKYECNLCVANKFVLPIYRWCVENNKKIIIISDMYLDRQTIKTILSNSGIDRYERLFISNEEQRTKQNGTLYPYVLDELKINEKQIVHIGNSFVADYYRAKKNGWKAVKIKTSYSDMVYDYNKFIKHTSYVDLRCLGSFINNHTIDKNAFYKIGYENFGPALVGFTKWLLDAMIQQKREVALFLGRDGYIMKQVYELLGFHKIIPAEYIEVSRRCFRIIDFVKPKTFEEINKLLPLRGITSIAEYIECLGLELKECQPVIKELQLDEKKTYKAWDLCHDELVKKLYYLLQDTIINNAKIEKKALLEYVNTFGLDRKVGLVDVGWGGTIQHYLEILLKEQQEDIDILGYYWGVANRAQELLGSEPVAKAQGYFYDCLSKGDKYDYQRPFDGLLETFFLQQVGSVKRFVVTEDSIRIIRENYEYANNPDVAEKVESIQKGALKFVKDFKQSILNEILDFNKEIMFANLYRICTNPTKMEMHLFKNVYFYDSGNMKKLFEDYNLFYVITHPRSFVDGYRESYWRIGYLKNIFRINISYMYICLNILPYFDVKHKR